jgi:UDPglucose 6-dehydrogenase
MREAPSLVVIKKLLEAGAKLNVYDPVAMKEAKRILGDKVGYVEDQYEALIEADGLFLITEWPEFKFPNVKIMKKLMRDQVIFDGRNVYDAEEMNKEGFVYYGIGTGMMQQEILK